MSLINHVTSKVKVTCENEKAYAKIVELYKKHLNDYSTCFQADGVLYVAMEAEIDTNFMSSHATGFLNGIVRYAAEIDPDAEITGTICWQDDEYNTGQVELIKVDGSYAVSDPVVQSREEYAIQNAATAVLIKELEKRGFFVNRKAESLKDTHTERWRVTICQEEESSSAYFTDNEYDKALHYGAEKKEDAYSVSVYEHSKSTGEYVFRFRL